MDTSRQSVGMRFLPVSHESSFSAVKRFAWQNVLDIHAVSETFAGTPLRLPPKSFLRPAWLNKAKIEDNLRWTLPTLLEEKFRRDLGEFTALLFDHRLKVCPLCFANGFHSLFHQITLLLHCPLHNCLLVDQCQQCGTAFGDYALSKALFDCDYKCSQCRAPQTGVVNQFHDFIAFRNEIEDSDSFVEIEHWLEAASTEFFLARAIVKATFFRSNDDHLQKCRFLLDVANAIHPFPNEFSGVVKSPEVTLLTWNLQTGPRKKVHILTANSNNPVWRRNLKSLRDTYLVAVRNLQRWVERNQSIESFKQAILDFYANGIRVVIDLSTSTITYVLFRHYFERWPVYLQNSSKTPTGFRFASRPPFQLYAYEPHDPRLAYYCVYYAVFAAIYWEVERAERLGKLDEITIAGVDFLLNKFLFRSDDRIAGGVVFRTVPHLPIPKYLASNFADAKSVFNSASNFIAVDGKFG